MHVYKPYPKATEKTDRVYNKFNETMIHFLVGKNYYSRLFYFAKTNLSILSIIYVLVITIFI